MDRLLRWAPLLGLCAVTCLAAVMYGNVFAGEIRGDDLSFHLAEATRMADCLRAGDFDFWNPSANASYASAYYYQAIPQLVPAALAALTGTTVLPWFQLCVFLPLVLAPAAAYRGLRVMGAAAWPAIGGATAILVAASNNRWGFGADGTFSVGLYTQTWSLAAFPLALGYGVRWVKAGTGLGAATAWSVFVTACHPFAGIALGVALVVGALAVAVRRLVRGADDAPRALWADLVAWLRQLARGARAVSWIARTSARIEAVLRPPDATAEPPRPPPSIGALAIRLPLLGLLLVLGAASIWLPVFVDYAGFGGFPHRVADEIGPGFGTLWDWLTSGKLLDAAFAGISRLPLLTLLVPIAIVFGRDRALPWLWSSALAFALLLGICPHLPRTGDDLFPMVRFLGPLQICLAMGAGAGAVAIALALWRATDRLHADWNLPAQAVIAAVATAAVVSIVVPGVKVAQWRATVITDDDRNHRDEITAITAALADQPHGRKQARTGSDNHWFNLLPYVDARVPALFQMGGGGLQASPNYDFLWSVGDPERTAWVFDAPYLTFGNQWASTMPDGEPVIETAHFTVVRLPAPGLVSAVEIDGTLPAGRFEARKRAIEWLKSEAALADRLMAYPGSGGLEAEPHGRVTDYGRKDSPGDAPDIVAAVVADQPTTFVVRESWHPRWRGFVDGNEVRVRRVTPDFFAVDVPVGEHLLAFRFDRPWWVWATWLLLGLAPLLGWWTGRRWFRTASASA